MSENQATEIVLLENCLKQYQILIAELKRCLQNMHQANIGYNEIKNELSSVVKMISAVEEVMQVYNF